MNFRTLKIIIGREYSTRVRKKSFLITTFLVPILFALLSTLPTFIMIMSKEKTSKVAVVDESGIVLPYLKGSETASFESFAGQNPEIIKKNLDSLNMDLLLCISPIDTVTKNLSASLYSVKPAGVEVSDYIKEKIDDALEEYRISAYHIDGLDKIIKDVRPNVKVVSYLVDESGNDRLNESGIYMLLSIILGMIIYAFISMFSGVVMSSVIEEKSSRIVEVLVSSVKATELLFGKIIGVSLVAMTQFFMWIALTVVLVTGIGAITGLSISEISKSATDSAQMSQVASSIGLSEEQIQASGLSMPSVSLTAPSDSSAVASQTEALPEDIVTLIATLSNINFAKVLVVFVLFFIFGYLLYASLFAAIGSAVENEADSQQLVLPLTIPLLIGFLISMMASKSPDSGIVFWGSMIPFTSPIVMMARVIFGVPTWELVLSLCLLIATFIFGALISAKLYRVGILRYGTKGTFKDLWKWIKLK